MASDKTVNARAIEAERLEMLKADVMAGRLPASALNEATAATPAAPGEVPTLIEWEDAHETAWQAAAAFRPSYFGENFRAHNWVVEAIRSAHMDGQRFARGLPKINRAIGGELPQELRKQRATLSNPAPVAAPAPASEAVASLRHVYQNLMSGGVRDTASAKRIAIGLLGPAIEQIERAIPAGDSADAPVQQAVDPIGKPLNTALKAAIEAYFAALKGEQPVEPSGNERGEV